MFGAKIVTSAEVLSAVTTWIQNDNQNLVVLSSVKVTTEDLASAWCSVGAFCYCVKVYSKELSPIAIQLLMNVVQRHDPCFHRSL